MTRNSLPSTIYSLALGALGVGTLVALTDWRALEVNAIPLFLFAMLSFILKRAGFHAAPEVTHSLVGIIDLAAVFSFGPVLGAWVAASSGFFYLFLNALRRDKHTFHELVEIPVFNAGLKIGMAYASSHFYLMLGGSFAPRAFTFATLPSVIAAALAWFVVDHIGLGLLELLRGGAAALANFLRAIYFYSLFIELLPLPFAIVIAVVYSALYIEMALMVALGLLGTAIVVQRFADASLDLERRRTEMAVMNEFGNALARATFDSEKVIDLLYEHARRIVPADLYRLELVQGEREQKSMLLALEATAPELRHPYETRLSPVFDYFSTHRDPVRAVDLARAFVQPLDATGVCIAAGNQVQIDGRPPRSVLLVPLFAGDEFIGVLSLFAARPRAYVQIHGRNLASMCGQAAVTIQNARLYTTERKRAGQLATISEVSRQVAALIDLDELLQKLVNQIRERFGYTHVHIFTVDGGYAVFHASTHPRGSEWRERGVGYRIGLEGIVGWVAATGEPLIVDDVSKDSRFVPYPDMEIDSTRSEIVVPLTIGKQVTGVLDVESSELHAFGDEDMFVLKTLAAQIAVAVEDARLFNAQKEEAYYLNVMLQVSENLAATNNLDEALETVVRITPLLVGVARCAVLMYRPSENKFVSAKAYGLSKELAEEFFKLEFPSDDQFAFAKMYRDRAPLMIEDTATSPLLRPELRQTFGVHSLLIAPLMTRREIVGALIVDQGARTRRFSPHEIEVVMGIANQAAVAIESARLSQAAEEKKQLEYELRLARQIQKSFLPAACPSVRGYQLCSEWKTAREVSGDFYDFVSLHGERQGMLIADVSDKGMAAAMFMALSRTILRTMAIGKPTARETLERANDLILADAHSEMFVTVFYAVLDPDANRLTYVNAGHNPPLFYRAAHKELTTLKEHGLALGVMPGISLEEHEIEMAPGDLVLMYTDGVTDAINSREEEFGMDRLADLVMTNAHQPVECIVDEITRAVTEFAGEGIHFDDVTMVALKRER